MENRGNYSLLGFSCETARKELQRYLDKKGIRLLVIKDAYEIAKGFKNIIQTKSASDYEKNFENRKEVMEYILDYMKQDSIPIEERREFPDRIINLNNLLEGIVNGGEIPEQGIKEGIIFLEEVRDWCKEKVSFGSCH